MPRFFTTLAVCCILVVAGTASVSAQERTQQDAWNDFVRGVQERDQQPTPELSDVEEHAGDYVLTSRGPGPRTGTPCTITLSEAARSDNLALERDSACEKAFSAFSDVNQWRLAGNDIVFLTTDGRELTVFRQMRSGAEIYAADHDGVSYRLETARLYATGRAFDDLF